MSLPGDDLVPRPRLGTTRAITIQAPAAEIWPWLVQMGQGRGWMYSYERLENLIRCDMHNADRILPEHQDLKAGDKARLGPEGYPSFDVTAIEPGCALILRGDIPAEQITSPLGKADPIPYNPARTGEKTSHCQNSGWVAVPTSCMLPRSSSLLGWEITTWTRQIASSTPRV